MKKVSIDKILDWADRNYKDIDFYPGCAEMGYEDKPVIAANWNNLKALGNYIENAYDDIELEWSDEWSYCNDCYKAIRISPDSYGWESSYVWISDCEIICHECIKNDPGALIDEYKNDTDRAVPSWAYDLIEKEGFICYSPDEYCKTFETGFHPGQNDDPKEVAKDIESNLPGYDFIFKINAVGQFDVEWSVFIRKQED